MPTCSTKCRARGLSLIEVMLGMAILGLFLTSIFIAQARLIRQSVIAKNKANVITAVDALLASWTLDWQNLPAEDTGTFPGHDQWQWQTHLADDPQWAELGFASGVVSVRHSRPSNGSMCRVTRLPDRLACCRVRRSAVRNCSMALRVVMRSSISTTGARTAAAKIASNMITANISKSVNARCAR